MSDFPFLGFGCGLRSPHYPLFRNDPPSSIDWVEVIAENYIDWADGRRPRSLATLEAVRRNLPVVIHGVSLSLGSTDPLDLDHLARVKALVQRIDPPWFSDHLCWTKAGGAHLHDLLPLPYTEEAIAVASDNISRTQEYLGRRILIENVSSYVTFTSSTMTEWEFIGEIVRRTGCGLLLDINNIYVSSRNHGFDPMDYLGAIDFKNVGQIHLAGHQDHGSYVIDTHDEPVRDEVWELYRWAVEQSGPVSTMIERDDNFPKWTVLEAEVVAARNIAESRGAHVESASTPARL